MRVKTSSFQDLNSDCQSMLSRFLIVLGFQIRDLWKFNTNIFISKDCSCPQEMNVYNNDVFSFRFALQNFCWEIHLLKIIKYFINAKYFLLTFLLSKLSFAFFLNIVASYFKVRGFSSYALIIRFSRQTNSGTCLK